MCHAKSAQPCAGCRSRALPCVWCAHLLGAVVPLRIDHHLRHHRVHRELGHPPPHLRQLAAVVQRPQRIELSQPQATRTHAHVHAKREHAAPLSETVTRAQVRPQGAAVAARPGAPHAWRRNSRGLRHRAARFDQARGPRTVRRGCSAYSRSRCSAGGRQHLLERADERLCGRRVHEVKVDQVVDPKALEHQHHLPWRTHRRTKTAYCQQCRHGRPRSSAQRTVVRKRHGTARLCFA